MDTIVIALRLAEVSFPEGHPQAGDRGPVFGFAVRHAEHVGPGALRALGSPPARARPPAGPVLPRRGRLGASEQH